MPNLNLWDIIYLSDIEREKPINNKTNLSEIGTNFQWYQLNFVVLQPLKFPSYFWIKVKNKGFF